MNRLGKRVLYTLNTGDAQQVIQDRRVAGTATKRGNDPKAGQTFPGVIVADFGTTVAAFDPTSLIDHFDDQWKMAHGLETKAPTHGYLAKLRDMDQDQYNAFLGGKLEEAEAQWKQSVVNASCNLQVWLDGTDTYWATSRSVFDPEQHYRMAPIDSFVNDDPDRIPDSEGHFVFID